MSELSPDYFNRPLAEVDPEIAEALRGELERQQRTLEMIASENFVPARGARVPGQRAHQQVRRGLSRARATTAAASGSTSSEQLAIDRAKALFGAEHANVQPHSGAQANAAVYHALLEPGRHDHGPRRSPTAATSRTA